MQKPSLPLVVVLGTGGTIAGEAASPDDDRGYRSAARGVDALVAAAGAAPGVAVESEQVAQLDSKDMDFATWRRLERRIAAHLARPEVTGVVVTHGTDTLEETAWFLARVLPAPKPVVLTAAMRPASSRQADGPANLADAIALAAQSLAGVFVAFAGAVHGAREIRKAHPTRLDAFSSGDAGPIARIEAGRLDVLRKPSPVEPFDAAGLPDDASAWPWVEIVTSDVGADGRAVEALVAAGVNGIVVAATGNGTLHQRLDASLRMAMASGVAVLRSTRCLAGSIVDDAPDAIPHAADLTPVKARVELILRLLDARRR